MASHPRPAPFVPAKLEIVGARPTDSATVLMRLETLVVRRAAGWVARTLGPDLAGQGPDVPSALDDLHGVIGAHVFLDLRAGIEPLRECPRAPPYLRARWGSATPHARPWMPRLAGLEHVTIDYEIRVVG